MLHYLLYAVVFLTMLTILVAAHEFGHFLVARLFKMDVEEFAIGFGKKLFTWMRRPMNQQDIVAATTGGSASALGVGDVKGSPVDSDSNETVFTIRALPLGGFVRIKGMVPEEDGSETQVENGFYSKAPWKRFLVLLAGPVFSYLSGVLVLVPMFMIYGLNEPLKTSDLGVIKVGGAADKAGLKERDHVVSVDGKPVKEYYDMVSIVRANPGKALPIVVQRDGETLSLTIVPTRDEKPSPVLDRDLEPSGQEAIQGKIGVGQPYLHIKPDFQRSVSEAIALPGVMVKGIAQIVTQKRKLKDEVGGPVSIAQATAEATDEGAESVFRLAGLLSISLGVMNLLPIVPFDGGQMMIALAEMFRRGRRLSIKVQGTLNAVGLAIIAVLFVSVMVIDFGRIKDDKNNPKPKFVESPQSQKK